MSPRPKPPKAAEPVPMSAAYFRGHELGTLETFAWAYIEARAHDCHTLADRIRTECERRYPGRLNEQLRLRGETER